MLLDFRLLSATHFATSLLPLTVRLIPVLTEIGRLIVGFRRAELLPSLPPVRDSVARPASRTGADYRRMDVQPHRARNRRDMPNQMCFQGVWYRRRSKTPKLTVATLFGTITLWRNLINRSTASNRRSFPWRSAWG